MIGDKEFKMLRNLVFKLAESQKEMFNHMLKIENDIRVATKMTEYANSLMKAYIERKRIEDSLNFGGN